MTRNELKDKLELKIARYWYENTIDSIEVTAIIMPIIDEYVIDTQNQWQPIETAPKDGSEILTYSDCNGYCITSWDSYVRWWSDINTEFTHWQPLPEFPKDIT